jgi:ATP-dependent DNA ligase
VWEQLPSVESIRHHIGSAEFIVDGEMAVLDYFQPLSLPEIQLLLCKDVLATLVVSIHVTSLAIEMMSPYFEGMNNCGQF